MKIGEPWVYDDPDNQCFGCSPHNEKGLRLVFLRTGERSVEVAYTAAAHYAGPLGILHGGVQAALLDEVMGAAAHTPFDEEHKMLVTADFRLRFRRPVPVGEPLVIRAEVVRLLGRSVFLEGGIFDAASELLTSGEAHWREVPDDHPARRA